MLRLLARRETGLELPCRIYDAENCRRARCLHLSKYYDLERAHTAGINSLDLDPVEHRHLLSGGGDGFVVVHNTHNTSGVPHCTYPTVCSVGQNSSQRHKYAVLTVQWYPVDTGLFVSSSMDKSLKVWDANSLKTAAQFRFGGCVYNHHLSPVATTHALIAVGTGESNQVHLLDLKSGSKTHTLSGHRKSVMAVRWSPQNEFLLATAGQDSRLRLWDVRSAKGSLRILDQHNGDTAAGPHSVSTAHDGSVNGLCFLPDGLHLLSFGTDSNLRLWDSLTGRNKLVNYGKIFNKRRTPVKFSVSHSSSAAVVFVPSEGNIEVFEIFSGDRFASLRGHYNQVNCCIYNSDSHELFSGANDRNILIWVPETQTAAAYEESLKSGRQKTNERINFTSRIGGIVDAWSSDED